MVLDDAFLPIQPIHSFLTYLESIERSPNTIRVYAFHLKLFWEYLRDAHLEWTEVGFRALADFIPWLRAPRPGVVSFDEQEAVRTESTINAILDAVISFYDYHQRAETVGDIPLYRSQAFTTRRYKDFLYHINKKKPVQTRLIRLKATKHIPQTLSDDQVQQLIQACHRKRDAFLVTLLYETGMRIGQALGLRHEDVQSWDNLIRVVPRSDNANGVRAKTREPYTIHVTEELMALYADYLVHEFGETDSDYVFVNLWEGAIGQPMTYGAALDLFSRLSRKTGMYARPHMLRHTHATKLLRSGMDAVFVQKRLGHAHIQTTINTYAHLTDDDLKAAYQAYCETAKEP